MPGENIAPGRYIIQNVGTNTCLGLIGSDHGTPLTASALRTPRDPRQLWEIASANTIAGDNYTIQNVQAGTCLALADGAPRLGQHNSVRISGQPKLVSPEQMWSFHLVANRTDVYTIANPSGPGVVFELSDGAQADESPVVGFEWRIYSPDQQWKLIPA